MGGLPQRVETNEVDEELIKKIHTLRERLRDAEFQNSARSQELISLKEQLTKLEAARNKRTRNNSITPSSFGNSSRIFFDGQNVLQLPSIYNFMPHLMDSPGSLKPALHVSKDRQGVSLVFGIPTIKRERTSYLLDTLVSLLDAMSQEDKDDCVIVIFIGETDIGFSKDVANGVKQRWRTKQNLDFCYLMMYCQKKARFYVQLEDDIVATPTFASTIKTFALQQETNQWLILEFSALGFIGKLFRTSDLSMVVEFFLMFHKDKPVDWLMDHILWVKVCNPEKDQQHCSREKSHLRIRFKPSLFQHVGKESSLKGKKQNLIDKDFKKAPLFQAHLNPKAVSISSLEPYQGYTLDRAYKGQTFFWAYPPQTDDVMRFKFDQEITIENTKRGSISNGYWNLVPCLGSPKTERSLPRGKATFDQVQVITLLSQCLSLSLYPGVQMCPAKLPGKPDENLKGYLARDSHPIKGGGVGVKPGREGSPEAKKNFLKYEFPFSSYKSVGTFTLAGLADGTVPQEIGKIVEMRIRVLGHNSLNWIMLSEIHIVPKGAR
ncbi:Alpha-1,3-mannosyl-glycoprotein 4-beta-N-acetylglucosaminyltransferase B [Stylophora pistillata]|uniref:Alpha-1,3-mannosyl-glycoprotein 4-beta-N-acetylglucosaminyltransferase B n=1 Tax=Stylophora pistillata TaxID=50429 RepID=A0A2B4RWT3_STYPI|nr:Alpha-1,3-mannosyl-glycoprotein 4-beta-N-acetylglucosaminyltransferase B [Stylophora pistillata]